MTKIGFVGLGLIGAPMCKNLVAAGHHIKVWNRTASRMEPLVADGHKRLPLPPTRHAGAK